VRLPISPCESRKLNRRGEKLWPHSKSLLSSGPRASESSKVVKQIVADFVSEGFEVKQIKEPDGTYTIRALLRK
jgi:hypothetical protein